ncbi:MAG: ABC transporter permease [Polyangiaceae bacterium]
MKALFVICAKDLRVLSRDKGALFWAGIFPVLFGVLFAAVFPSEHDAEALPVAAHVADGSTISFSGTAIRAITVESNDEAIRLVRRGDAIAALDVGPTGIELITDPSRPAESAVVEAATLRAMAVASGAPELRRRALPGSHGLKASGFALAFPAAVLWGLIGCAGAFATASVTERRSGTYLRLRSLPISTRTILGGKVLACFIASIADSALLLVIACVVFRLHIERFPALVIVVASCAACFAGITVLLGCIGKSEQSVGGAGWALLLLFAMLGGAMVPLSVMPRWLRLAADVSPVKWGIAALEGVTTRGLSLREVLPHCGVLVLVGMVSVASAAMLSQRSALE